MKESEIRDYLAENLEIVEPGLTLLAKEYLLPNQNGARGRIDLLARDGPGNLVVIELKRSNSSARSALHELMKYLGLLQRERGIAAERIRCVLVSTEWEELLIPFSEQADSSPFTIQGRMLLQDSNGQPKRTEPVSPLPKKDVLSWPEEFLWLTFADQESLNAVASVVSRMLPELGLKNQVLVKCASLRPHELQYPFGLIVPFFPFSRDEIRAVFSCVGHPIELLPDFAHTDLVHDPIEHAREATEASLQSAICCLEGVGEATFRTCDGFLAEREYWRIDDLLRLGPAVEDTVLLSDEDIMEGLSGIRGAKNSQFTGGVDPQHRMQLRHFERNLQEKLSRYQWWAPVEPAILAATDVPGTRIAANAFCPKFTLRRIASFLATGDEDFLPSFRVTIASPSSRIDIYGRVAWDGKTDPPQLDDLLPDLGVSRNVLRLATDNGEVGLPLVRALGFVFPVLVVVESRGERVLSQPCRFLSDWISRFPDAVSEIRTRLGPFVGR